MVPLRNPHQAGPWGFLFACLPILSAWMIDGGGRPSNGSSSRFSLKRRHSAPEEPHQVSDYEIDQLGRDSWSLYGAIEMQALLPCTHVQARRFWRHE
jgi:hypothetical protein